MGGVKTHVKTRKNIKYTHATTSICERVKFYNSSPTLWISLPRREIMWSATLLRWVSSPLLQSIVGIVTPRAAFRLWDVYPGGLNAQINKRIYENSLKQRQAWPGHPGRAVRGTAFFPRAMRGHRVWGILRNVGRIGSDFFTGRPGPAGRANAFLP